MTYYEKKRKEWLTKMVARVKGNKEQLIAIKMLRQLKEGR